MAEQQPLLLNEADLQEHLMEAEELEEAGARPERQDPLGPEAVQEMRNALPDAPQEVGAAGQPGAGLQNLRQHLEA